MRLAIEQEICEDYLKRSQDEQLLSDSLEIFRSGTTVVATQGFEQRTAGALKTLAQHNVNVDEVVIARYANDDRLDHVQSSLFEKLAERVSPKRWTVVTNNNDGGWIVDALQGSSDTVIVDITGVSNKAMFPTLDRLSQIPKNIYLAYTEAQQYWPKKAEWDDLRHKLTANQSIAEIVDQKPWMFSYEHHVELVPGHEGYDASGTGRALVAFLPFKCSRLAAVLGNEDYAEKVFIAGRPPSSELAWRLSALKEINESITRGSLVAEICTFGYRRTIEALAALLFHDDSLLWRYDVHFAALGSKLQTIGSWIVCRSVPSMTVITSVPSRYYKNAFSAGIGPSWCFRLSVAR